VAIHHDNKRAAPRAKGDRPDNNVTATRHVNNSASAVRFGSEDDYFDGRFHRANALTERNELMFRRWPPTGNRELWIKYGPAGPPEVTA
jgi:hypothetical protein